MQEVYEFLKKNSTFYLATTEGGQPRVRPFGAVARYEGKLYICTNNQKDVFAQMKQNPEVELCAMDPDGTWLRLQAKASVDGRREAKAQMLAENPSLNGLYKLDDGVFEVLCLTDARARFCSFTAETREVAF